MTIYVDTGAWIALYEPSDHNHEAAKQALEELLGNGASLVTGWHTIVEFLDGLVHHYDQARAAGELTRLRSSPRLTVLEPGPHRDEAMDGFRDRPDWDVDLSDCLSFALMDDNDIETVFTFDSDFEKPGFQLVPEA